MPTASTVGGVSLPWLTPLASAQAHVLSQFLMCAFASPWVAPAARPWFLAGNQAAPTALFGDWVAHFSHPNYSAASGALVATAAERAAAASGADGGLHAAWALGPPGAQPPTGGAAWWAAVLARAPGAAGERARLNASRNVHHGRGVAVRANLHGDFNCYHPAEMQSRTLAGGCAGDPHHLQPGSPFLPRRGAAGAAAREAEMASALRTLRLRLNLVGVTELYSLSLCLALHAVGAAAPPEHCHDAGAALELAPPATWGTPRGVRAADVGAPVWAAVDRLTALDARLYAEARALLLHRFEEFNAEARRRGGRPLGRHLLEERPQP